MFKEYPKREVFEIGEWESWYNFYESLLCGDTTDNIIGCGYKKDGVYKSGKKKGQEYSRRKGVGPKEARSLLVDCATEYDMFEVCHDEYCKLIIETNPDIDTNVNGILVNKLALDSLIENARLLYMVRELNTDGTPVMWVPPVKDING